MTAAPVAAPATAAPSALSALFGGSPTGQGDSPVLLTMLGWARKESEKSVTPTALAAPAPATTSLPVVTGVTLSSPDQKTGAVAGAVNATDPNGYALSYSLSGAQPGGGSVTVNPNGTFTYTPTQAARLAAGQTAGGVSDSFTVAVSDGPASTTTTVKVPVFSAALTLSGATATTGAAPAGVALIGNRAYVANQYSYTVSVIDTSTPTPALLTTIPVGYLPTGVAANPAGTQIYVTNSYSNSVSVINPATNTVTATVYVGSYPQGIVASATRAYVTNYYSHTVSVIDTTQPTPTVIATIPVGYYPVGITLSPDGTRLYATNTSGYSNSVSVINTATNTVMATVAVGAGPSAIAVGATRAVVTNLYGNTVSILDTTTATPTVTATIAVPNSPNSVSLSPDGTLAYVIGANDTMTVIDTRTATITQTITTDPTPATGNHMLTVSPDGTHIYITDNADNALHTVTLAHINHPPTAGTPTYSTPDPTTGAVTISLAFNDFDGDPLSYSVSSPADGTVTTTVPGTYVYTPTQVAREIAPILAGPDTDPFTVTANDGYGGITSVTLTPTIAPSGPVPTDATATLQAAFDHLKPGGTLSLAPGTYQYSNILKVDTSGVTINGDGATLQSTDPALAALQILADNVSLSNLNLTGPVGLPRVDSTDRVRVLYGGNGFTMSDVNITGGTSAGVYLVGASNFQLNRVTVTDTGADGIQITDGSNNGQLNNVTTDGTGDDGIAIVSYLSDPGPVHDIVVNSPVVKSTAQSRGLVVVGGQRITFNNINVSNTSSSGVYIGSQGDPFDTASTSDITVNGGTITGSNTAPFPFGAITVNSQDPGQSVTNVTISNVTINNPSPGQFFNIGVLVGGNAPNWFAAYTATPQGTIGNIVLQNIAIFESTVLSIVGTNAPPGSFTATGITMNGLPVTVTTTPVT